MLYRIFLETLTKGELFQEYTNSITSLGKVLEKPKCPILIQWKIPLYFWKPRLEDREKMGKCQKEDLDQPQP